MTIPLGGRRRGGAEKGESASNAQAALFAGTGHRTAGASKKDQAAPRSPSSAEDSTADLERVIAVIHEKFKKKSTEQQKRARESVRQTVSAALESINDQVGTYERGHRKQLERLKQCLHRIRGDRAGQVHAFRTKCRSLKRDLKAAVNAIAQSDALYEATIAAFFQDSTNQLEEHLGGVAAAKEGGPP